MVPQPPVIAKKGSAVAHAAMDGQAGKRYRRKKQQDVPNMQSSTSPSASSKAFQETPSKKSAHKSDTGLDPRAMTTPRSQPQSKAGHGWGELPESERQSRIGKLQEMGFGQQSAQQALTNFKWDVNKALDHLVKSETTGNIKCSTSYETSISKLDAELTDSHEVSTTASGSSSARSEATNKSKGEVLMQLLRGGQQPTKDTSSFSIAPPPGFPQLPENVELTDSQTVSVSGLDKAARPLSPPPGLMPPGLTKGSPPSPPPPSPPPATSPRLAHSEPPLPSSPPPMPPVLPPFAGLATSLAPFLPLAAGVPPMIPGSLMPPYPFHPAFMPPPLVPFPATGLAPPLAPPLPFGPLPLGPLPLPSNLALKADSIQKDAAPKKHLARVKVSWKQDPQSTEAQLTLTEGDFVYVWNGSMTGHGWVYGEDLVDGSRAGWLPVSMLTVLPPYLVWLRAFKDVKASSPTEMEVQEGSVLLVNTMEQTPAGWVWAEQPDAKVPSPENVDDDAKLEKEQEDKKKVGWVPSACLQWP